MSGAAFHTGSSKQDYATPWEFIRAVEQRFGPITFDLAAGPENQKSRAGCHFTEDDDAFKQNWHRIDGLLWLNPPFRNIAPWAEKCAAESRLGARIAFLVPASVGSNWFADHVWGHALVLPVRPRLSFDGKAPYPKDLILCHYALGAQGFVPWRWKR